MGDNVADVTATVDGLFEEFVEVFEEKHLEGIVGAAEEILVEGDQVLISLLFEQTELVIERFDFWRVHAAPKGPNEFEDELGGPLDNEELAGEIDVANLLGRNAGTFGELLDAFGDFVKSAGQGFDVLALESRDEGGVDGGADLFCDTPVGLPSPGQVIPMGRVLEVLAESDEALSALANLLSAGLEQPENLIFLAQEFLE